MSEADERPKAGGKLRVIFFDAAGTLFEPREPVGESYAVIARRFGLDADGAAVDAAFRRTFHNYPRLAFGPGKTAQELRLLERQWWHDLVEQTFAGLGSFSDFEAYFEALFEFFGDPANWVADAEARSTLTELKDRGFILGVISNFDHRIYRIIEGLEMRSFFDSITISSEAGWAKPAVELFNYALGRHNVRPSEALHVGDTEHLDVAGARAAGLSAALINHRLPQRVIVEDRTARIASLGEVLEVVREFECE